MESCEKHPHEVGAAICRRCGGAWCRDCLVYAFGPKKPPYCMSCAMVAGGVRTASTRPPMPKREMKARMKAAKAEAKAGRGAPVEAEPAVSEPDAASLEPVSVAADADTVAEPATTAPGATGDTDWSTPWWEDRQPTFAD
ncbi:MAG: hypothetical protein ACSLFP_00685 [Acidimicrobiales bacterium]